MSQFFCFFNILKTEEEENSGTTATVCLLRNSVELVVAHVGDSRAILCRNGKAQRLTTDHTGDLFAERVSFFAVESIDFFFNFLTLFL